MGRRSFGTVRRLPSGRWQARYRTPDGRLVTAPETFATKGDAGRWLTMTESNMLRGSWLDPALGEVTLKEYAPLWLQDRRVKGQALAPRTRDTYQHSLDMWILPKIGHLPLNRLTPAVVRPCVSR